MDLKIGPPGALKRPLLGEIFAFVDIVVQRHPRYNPDLLDSPKQDFFHAKN